MNVVDVLLAEFRESIMHAIPQMFIFLQPQDRLDPDFHKAFISTEIGEIYVQFF